MTTTTKTTRKGTYQMLWDCPSCGTRKLLGVDHRHCPNCGAPQEENLRYFPSAEDRVPTEFRGSDPDWECSHCGTPNGSIASHCGGCGAPRGDAKQVFVRAAVPSGQGETGEQAKQEWRERQAKARAERAQAHAEVDEQPFATGFNPLAWLREQPRRWIWVGLALVILGVLMLAICDRQVSLAVYGHSWTRVIPVERFKTLHQSDWCASTPSDARITGRSREVHHYDKVPDGEDCKMVKGSCSESCRNVDNGNGSFSEVCTETCSSDRRECTTRYREVPVYEDRCSYDVDRWALERQAEAKGEDLEPFWPDPPAYAGCTRQALGCERLGPQYGVYVVHYASQGDADEIERFECQWDEDRWRATQLGARFEGEVSRLSGELDCETLVPAK